MASVHRIYLIFFLLLLPVAVFGASLLLLGPEQGASLSILWVIAMFIAWPLGVYVRWDISLDFSDGTRVHFCIRGDADGDQLAFRWLADGSGLHIHRWGDIREQDYIWRLTNANIEALRSQRSIRLLRFLRQHTAEITASESS